ncbi:MULTISPECIES: ATP-binding protein, partial [unclassified Streptomyces]|uniref:sensor histidine kinase n=1 Tax=unclassified Streptomyces TaxID=2593676 RepID=UPI00081DAFFC
RAGPPVPAAGPAAGQTGEASAEAARAESFVEVELRAERTTAVIRVSDTGPGVPPELRERVFAEGWSTKQPAAPPLSGELSWEPSGPPRPAFRRGRGIGLALVRRLSERYGGMARVTARAGGGAVFTVVLPEALAPDDLAGDAPPIAADAPSARQLTPAGESR